MDASKPFPRPPISKIDASTQTANFPLFYRSQASQTDSLHPFPTETNRKNPEIQQMWEKLDFARETLDTAREKLLISLKILMQIAKEKGIKAGENIEAIMRNPLFRQIPYYAQISLIYNSIRMVAKL